MRVINEVIELQLKKMNAVLLHLYSGKVSGHKGATVCQIDPELWGKSHLSQIGVWWSLKAWPTLKTDDYPVFIEQIVLHLPPLIFLSSWLNRDRALREWRFIWFFPGIFLETPLCLEVVLCEMYTGIHLARNSVRAHFDHFKELREAECDYNSGYFSRKYPGSMCLLLFFFSVIMRLIYSEY